MEGGRMRKYENLNERGKSEKKKMERKNNVID